MVPESRLDATEHGLVPNGEGWFVLNAREARWRPGQGRGAYCIFEGEPESRSWESISSPSRQVSRWRCTTGRPIRRTFLVLAGKALLIVEAHSRGSPSLRPDDIDGATYVNTPWRSRTISW